MFHRAAAVALGLALCALCLAADRGESVERSARQIQRLKSAGFDVVDYHVHLKGGLTLDDVKQHAERLGIRCGIAPNCGLKFPITDDKGIYDWVKENRGKGVLLGMQCEGREWVTMFSPEAVAQFDYVFTDSMTFTDPSGKRMRTWIDEEVGKIADPQAFMDMLVEKIVGIMTREPIDIYANATFLPNQIAKDYDALWTEPRMVKVIDAAVKSGVAIEINARYRIPSARFIKLAKSKGAKFSFGTNNGGKDDLGALSYCLQMVRECGLTPQDMFVPRPDGKKRVQVQGLPK